MLSFLNSFGASSNFQKHRLILTSKNYEAPDQTSLKKIIQTFRGEDQQTRSQIAFATIIKKIHTSDSNDNWIYLLKNLIIFDRVVQENCFLEQITTLNLKPIETYSEKNQNAKALNSENILKSYWKLIQYKSLLLSQKSVQKSVHYMQIPNAHESKSKRNNSFSKPSNSQLNSKKSPQNKSQTGNLYDSQRSILSVSRSQKLQFLKTLSIQQIYKQSIQLQNLFECIFKMISSIENDRSKPKKKKSLSIEVDNFFTDNKESFKKDLIISKKSSKIKEQNSSLYESFLLNNQNLQSNQSNNEQNQKYKTLKDQFFNSKVVAYLHLQLLYKLLSAYSNQLICIKMLISHLLQQTSTINGLNANQNLKNNKTIQNQQISEVDVNLWKKIIINYLAFSQKIITYVERHKHVKGFQLINYQELSPFLDFNILGILDDYIDHKNTLQEPDIVKVQELGILVGGINNQIKVQRKAQWSYQKALTARKLVFPSRNLKEKNNAFYNWHNSFSTNFPPKQVLTIDLLMQMRQNPQNPATDILSQDDEDQSIYQPFIVNRHSCIYNFRQSNITAVSEFEFISLEQMKKKDEEKLQSAVSKKTKNFYYFKTTDGQKQFNNIYSIFSQQNGSVWVK